MSMVGYVDWSKVEVRETPSGNKGKGESIYLNFSEGKFKVRLIGRPYFFLQTFIPKKLTGAEKDIAVISPGEDQDPLIKLEILPQQRGAINVLHRNDGNKLKVMRFGSAIYKHIRNYAMETGIDPADLKQGIDFVIEVKDPGGNSRNRQYTVTPLNNTPITKEEAKKIKDQGGMHKIEEMFAPTPLEKINEYIEQYDLADKSSKVSGENTEFEDSRSTSRDDDEGDDSDDEDISF